MLMREIAAAEEQVCSCKSIQIKRDVCMYVCMCKVIPRSLRLCDSSNNFQRFSMWLTDIERIFLKLSGQYIVGRQKVGHFQIICI